MCLYLLGLADVRMHLQYTDILEYSYTALPRSLKPNWISNNIIVVLNRHAINKIMSWIQWLPVSCLMLALFLVASLNGL